MNFYLRLFVLRRISDLHHAWRFPSFEIYPGDVTVFIGMDRESYDLMIFWDRDLVRLGRLKSWIA